MPKTKLQNCLLNPASFPEKYTQHYISKLLSLMHRLRIEQTQIEDLQKKKTQKTKYSSPQLQLRAYISYSIPSSR